MPTPSILLVANRTCPCPDVLDAVARLADDGRVHVVAPALNSRLRHWVSDVDDAIAGAHERLEQAVASLRGHGIDAHGSVGDSNPLTAIADTLVDFDATGIVISTFPDGQSNWLERDLPGRAGERFGRPVVHLVSRYGLAVLPS